MRIRVASFRTSFCVFFKCNFLDMSVPLNIQVDAYAVPAAASITDGADIWGRVEEGLTSPTMSRTNINSNTRKANGVVSWGGTAGSQNAIPIATTTTIAFFSPLNVGYRFWRFWISKGADSSTTGSMRLNIYQSNQSTGNYSVTLTDNLTGSGYSASLGTASGIPYVQITLTNQPTTNVISILLSVPTGYTSVQQPGYFQWEYLGAVVSNLCRLGLQAVAASGLAAPAACLGSSIKVRDHLDVNTTLEVMKSGSFVQAVRPDGTRTTVQVDVVTVRGYLGNSTQIGKLQTDVASSNHGLLQPKGARIWKTKPIEQWQCAKCRDAGKLCASCGEVHIDGYEFVLARELDEPSIYYPGLWYHLVPRDTKDFNCAFLAKTSDGVEFLSEFYRTPLETILSQHPDATVQ